MPQVAKIGMALLFVAGIVGGFLMGTGLRPTPKGDKSLVDDRAVTPVPVEPRTGSVAAPDPLRSALAAMPAPVAVAGMGRITGRVVDEEGTPLSSVEVRAVPSRIEQKVRKTEIARSALGKESVSEAIRTYWKLIQIRKALTRAALTDETGSYEIAGLTDREYMLFASRKGRQVAPANPRSSAVHPGDVVDFVARAQVALKIDVLLPDGSQPEEARVTISKGPWFKHTESWRPAQPGIELTRGTYALQVTAGEGDRFTSEKETVTVKPGATSPEMSVRLRGRSLLRGRVVVPPEAAVAVVQVLVLSESQGLGFDPETLVTKGRVIPVHRRKGYFFSVLDLPPGPCLVGAAWNLRSPAVFETVTLGSAISKVELTLPPPEPRDSVVLSVTDPQGQLLRDCSVSARAKRGGRRGSFAAGQVLLQPDGTFLIVHSPGGRGRGAEEDPRFVAVVEASEYGRKEVEYAPRQTQELAVQFEEPAHLEVSVESYKGSSFEGRLFLVLHSKEGKAAAQSWGRLRGAGKLSAEGVQTFGPTLPGDYEIVAYMREGRHTTWPVKKQRLTLERGKNQVSLPLPRLHTLTVEMSKPVPGARLWLEPVRQGRWNRSGTIGQDGRCVFEHLSLGVYKLSLWSREQTGEMRVRIPFQTVVRFTPKARSALRVRVTDQEGYLARLGLRSGDLVTGMDGVAFKSSNHIEALMFGALSKQRVKLSVQREGRSFAVEANPKTLAGGGEELGGSLTPSSR